MASPKTNYDIYGDDEEEHTPVPEFTDPVDATGRAIDSQPAYDGLINAELLLPQNGEYQPVQVLGRTVGPDGHPEGNYSDNHRMNTLSYDVQFPEGDIKEYAANIIAENLLNQGDDDGFSITKLQSIVDHRTTNEALHGDDMYALYHQGQKRIRKSTVGWQLLVQWHNHTKQWVPLSILKESNPVEAAEYRTRLCLVGSLHTAKTRRHCCSCLNTSP
jgi:hypothetical protein